MKQLDAALLAFAEDVCATASAPKVRTRERWSYCERSRSRSDLAALDQPAALRDGARSRHRAARQERPRRRRNVVRVRLHVLQRLLGTRSRDARSSVGEASGRQGQGLRYRQRDRPVDRDRGRDSRSVRSAMEVRAHGEVWGCFVDRRDEPFHRTDDRGRVDEASAVLGLLVGTGAAGNGCGIESLQVLATGHVVEIEPIGTLRNTVRRDRGVAWSYRRVRFVAPTIPDRSAPRSSSSDLATEVAARGDASAQRGRSPMIVTRSMIRTCGQ